jgi:2-dehydropantoate 2-reductase
VIAILGAGSVGLVLGARLAAAGTRVIFLTRSEEQAARIRAEGVAAEDLIADRRSAATADAISLARFSSNGIAADLPVLVCTRGEALAGAARALARAAPRALPVCMLNDVPHEAALAALFPGVIGGVVRVTCTRRDARSAVCAGSGRIVLGDHPSGVGEATRSLALALRGAGFDVGLSARIADDKWLKLCINLMSAPNALVRRPDHATRAFVELKARLLEEARAALAAAGITARSCDGRDRSLDDEIRWQRESLASGQSSRPLPIYNQVWTALSTGGSLEADAYHERILSLCDRHGIAAPLNRRVLAVLLSVAREKRGPECVGAEELIA